MPIVQLKLIKDIVDMILDGGHLDIESNSNFFVAQTGLDEAYDLRFPSSQTSSIIGARLTGIDSSRRCSHRLKSQICNLWGAQRFSSHDCIDAAQKILQLRIH
jgi:hypothetical protein